MTHKKKLSVLQVIRHVVMIVPTIFSLAFKVAGLFSLEAKIAGRSLVIILMLGFLLGLLLTAFWLCLLTIFTVYLVSIHWSLLSALGLVAALNAIFILIVFVLILQHKNNLTFPEIRRQFHNAWYHQDD